MSAGKGKNAEILAAMKLAMETEKRGLKNYLSFALKTKDVTGKNMFILLSRDELDHFEILERALSKLEISGSWEEIEIRESLVEQVMPKLRERDVKVKGERGVDQVDAIRAAMEQERRSAELYREQYAKATDPAARKTFQKLMEMENAHYDILQAELDNITDTGFWFQIPEFDLEEEKS
ncbi:MAG TPA: ferritin family protein [Acidobacteriota bacterium]|nr:ferritin family protein [Acidobacteriota bacterium]